MKYLSGCAMVFLGLAANAHGATIFASGKVYGSGNQDAAECYLFNAGVKPIKIIAQAIRDEDGNGGELNSTCPNVLTPGAGCLVGAQYTVYGSSAYDCEIIVKSSTGLRGSLEMRQDGTVLQSQPLR